MDHRAAPDDRIVLVQEEPDRHQADAIAATGDDLAAFVLELRLLPQAHHQGDVRSVDVAVEQADLRTGVGEREGYVDAGRRLPDAALAAGNGNDVFDVRDQLLVAQ